MKDHSWQPVLYSPASHTPESILARVEKSHIPRLALDTEDALDDDKLELAMKNLRDLFGRELPTQTAFFIRPASPDVLDRMLEIPGIEQLGGFILPKVTPDLFSVYAKLLGESFAMLPILEDEGVFHSRFREELLAAFMEHRQQIDCVRIGANDLARVFGVPRRSYGPLLQSGIGRLIDDIIYEFRCIGKFVVTAPVNPTFALTHREKFEREVTELVEKRGLLGQTAIHPDQIPLLLKCYAITEDDAAYAKLVLGTNRAVSKYEGSMVEPATDTAGAEWLLERGTIFGIRPS